MAGINEKNIESFSVQRKKGASAMIWKAAIQSIVKEQCKMKKTVTHTQEINPVLESKENSISNFTEKSLNSSVKASRAKKPQVAGIMHKVRETESDFSLDEISKDQFLPDSDISLCCTTGKSSVFETLAVTSANYRIPAPVSVVDKTRESDSSTNSCEWNNPAPIPPPVPIDKTFKAFSSFSSSKLHPTTGAVSHSSHPESSQEFLHGLDGTPPYTIDSDEDSVSGLEVMSDCSSSNSVGQPVFPTLYLKCGEKMQQKSSNPTDLPRPSFHRHSLKSTEQLGPSYEDSPCRNGTACADPHMVTFKTCAAPLKVIVGESEFVYQEFYIDPKSGMLSSVPKEKYSDRRSCTNSYPDIILGASQVLTPERNKSRTDSEGYWSTNETSLNLRNPNDASTLSLSSPECHKSLNSSGFESQERLSEVFLSSCSLQSHSSLPKSDHKRFEVQAEETSFPDPNSLYPTFQDSISPQCQKLSDNASFEGFQARKTLFRANKTAYFEFSNSCVSTLQNSCSLPYQKSLSKLSSKSFAIQPKEVTSDFSSCYSNPQSCISSQCQKLLKNSDSKSFKPQEALSNAETGTLSHDFFNSDNAIFPNSNSLEFNNFLSIPVPNCFEPQGIEKSLDFSNSHELTSEISTSRQLETLENSNGKNFRRTVCETKDVSNSVVSTLLNCHKSFNMSSSERFKTQAENNDPKSLNLTNIDVMCLQTVTSPPQCGMLRENSGCENYEETVFENENISNSAVSLSHSFNPQDFQQPLQMPCLEIFETQPGKSPVFSNSDDTAFASPSPPLRHGYFRDSGCECYEARRTASESEEDSVYFRYLPYYMKIDIINFESDTGFIDSHCHLDFLFKRQSYEGTHSDYRILHKETYPKSFEGCIAVFCDPFTFHKACYWEKHLSPGNVWGSFGCHPHFSKDYCDMFEYDLTTALSHSKARALGEIGLDYSNKNNCVKEVQHEVFRRQLKIANSKKLPLVIHCRDANEDTMAILKEEVPPDHPIHLHCFTDDWSWAERWLAAFPNLFIGLTNLVTFHSAQPTQQVAKRLPLSRLLIETDAPYFVPRLSPKDTRYSHPGMAIHAAAQIAVLRRCDLKVVLYWTRRNTRRVYGV